MHRVGEGHWDPVNTALASLLGMSNKDTWSGMHPDIKDARQKVTEGLRKYMHGICTAYAQPVQTKESLVKVTCERESGGICGICKSDA